MHILETRYHIELNIDTTFVWEKDKMEVDIISRQIVKPSSPTIHLKPFKRSLFNQLTPIIYTPLILFYLKNHSHPNNPQTDHLKNSLSETLNGFYPFSGRLKNNHFIDYYDEGIP